MLLGPRAAWVPAIFGIGMFVATSCGDSYEKATPVPAKPGIQQPEPGGTLLDEQEACERITAAEDLRRRSLMCDELVHAPCPFYVRPAGTGCWRYPEESVAECETAIHAYGSCFDFEERRCVITAVEAPDLNCPPLGTGSGGEGGQPSTGGTGGSSGASGGGGEGG